MVVPTQPDYSQKALFDLLSLPNIELAATVQSVYCIDNSIWLTSGGAIVHCRVSVLLYTLQYG